MDRVPHPSPASPATPDRLSQFYDKLFRQACGAEYETRKRAAREAFGAARFDQLVELVRAAPPKCEPDMLVVLIYERCKSVPLPNTTIDTQTRPARSPTASRPAAASASMLSAPSLDLSTLGRPRSTEADPFTQTDESGPLRTVFDSFLKDKNPEASLVIFASSLEGVKGLPWFHSLFPSLLVVDFNSKEVRNHLKDARTVFLRERSLESSADNPPSLYGFLQSLDMSPFDPARRDGEPRADENIHSAHFARQMARNYLGDTQLHFLAFVRRHDTRVGADLYFRGLSIVQSSGTGKTRLVLEMANFTPLLFICLRDVEARPDHGFPLGDKRVSAYFRKHNANDSLATCDLHVAAFVGAWFQVLTDKLNKKLDPKEQYAYLKSLQQYVDAQHTSGRCRKSDSVALQNLMTERDDFFKKVVEKAEELIKKAPEDPSNNHDPTFEFCLRESFSNLRRHLGKVRDYVWNLDENKNARKLTGGKTARKPPVFVAFDECTQLCLSSGQQRQDGEHQLNSLRRAWYYLLRLENGEFKNDENPHLWLILLSTNSAATVLIDDPDNIPSLRRSSKEAIPTFVGLGLDVMLHDQPPLVRARDVTRIEFLRAYGRPLWTSLPMDHFWQDAQAKLLGTSLKKYDDLLATQKRNAVFNVLASRLCLRFVPVKNEKGHEEARALARESVNRHMRILERVQMASLVVSSPSEPVLAIAALRTMVPKTDPTALIALIEESHVRQRYYDILSSFHDTCLAVVEGHTLKGVTGELMARLVFLAGWDAAKLTTLLAESPGSKRKQSSDTFSSVDHPHIAPRVGASSTTDSRGPSSAAASVTRRKRKGQHRKSPKDTEVPEPRKVTIDEDKYTKILVEPLPLLTWLESMATLSEQSQVLLRRRIDELRVRVSVELGQASPHREANRTTATATDSRAAGRNALPGSSSLSEQATLCSPEVNAYVNFTHFDVLPVTISSISCDYLWWCWKRGVAIQAVHDQPGIDGIIPVFVGDLDRHFAPLELDQSGLQGQTTKDERDADSIAAKHMTYVAWEAKNSHTAYASFPALCKDMDFRGPVLLPAGEADEPCAPINEVKKDGAKATTRKATQSKKRRDDQKNDDDDDKEVGLRKSAQRGAEAEPEVAPSLVPITPRGLLTVLVEFGTDRKIQNEKTESSPQKKPVAAKVRANRRLPIHLRADDEDWMYLDIRGLSSKEAYPCLDTLEVRRIAQKILERFPVDNNDQPENCVLSPIHAGATIPQNRGHITVRTTQAGRLGIGSSQEEDDDDDEDDDEEEEEDDDDDDDEDEEEK